MRGIEVRARQFALATVVVALACALLAASAGASGVRVKEEWMPAPAAPETPSSFTLALKGSHLHNVNLNQVGVIKIGARKAKNILVFVPGTSGGGSYIVPFAKSLVQRLPGWQVWSIERRENLLEDQTFVSKAKRGLVTPKELFHYYLGYITEGGKPHMIQVPPEQVAFGKNWGMNVAVEDIHTVIEKAKALGGKVVLSGHSLGGSVVTAYATWDFAGSPGANGLSGLVYDDGGSGPTPITKEQAEERLSKLKTPTNSPWLAFGGIGSPFLGLFSTLGAMGTVQSPNEASLAETFPLLPGNLKPKNEKGELIPVTNEAEFGFGVNVGSSPATLIAAQAHVGAGLSEAADEEGLFTWNGAGAVSPLRRYAEMLAGTGLNRADGDEWYFPERLTIDTGAVAEGNANPAQEVLGEHAIHGHELPSTLKILAIGTELGKSNVLKAAEILAEQSGIPAENLTLINKESEYAHNDPAAAEPDGNIDENAFYAGLVPYLEGIE